jgi:hypothetical protein
LRIGVVVVLLAVAMSQLTASADAKSSRLVGQAAGSQAFVGVVSDGATVLAYVCDGKRVSQWFDGRLARRGATRLRNASGAGLTLQLAAGGATGTVTLKGRSPLRFTLTSARAKTTKGPAGLFERTERLRPVGATESLRVGWIRLNDGRVKGLTERRVSSRVTLATAPASPPLVALVPLNLLPRCTFAVTDPAIPPALRPPPSQLCNFGLPPRTTPAKSDRIVPAATGATLSASQAALISAEARAIVNERLRRLGVPSIGSDAQRTRFANTEAALRNQPALRTTTSALAAALRARDATRAATLLDNLRDAAGRGQLPRLPGSNTTLRLPFPDLTPPPPAPAPEVTGLELRPRDFTFTLNEEEDTESSALAQGIATDRLSIGAFNAGRHSIAFSQATTTFDVPVGVTRVRMRIVQHHLRGFVDTQCFVGASTADWTAGFWLAKRTAAGADGPRVLEFVDGDVSQSTCLLPSFPGPPTPPPLIGVPFETTIAFTADPQIRSYRVTFFAGGFTSTAGAAQAFGDATQGFDKITITFQR